MACGDITKYKSKLKDCAGDGFIQCANGGKTGTEVCWRGDEKWYKECCAPCDDYPYLENQIPEGYVKGDSCDSCDGMKYKTKVGECAEGYEWKDESCKKSCDNTCSVGNILYSDHTCSSCKIEGKTPIGVVSYADNSNRLAINLERTTMQWGGDNTDIAGLTNKSSSSAAMNDDSGKTNTSIIVNALGDSADYAAGYCYNYTTAGTSKGDWYLPVAWELDAATRPNESAVNEGLSVAGGTSVSSYHWSSTEKNNGHAWRASTISSVPGWSSKSDDYGVRCVLAFEDNGDGTAQVCGKDYIYSCSIDEDNHITGGVGDSCANMYKSCKCTSGYFWNGNRCSQPCTVGSILNSDMTCSTSKVSGKTPIGVVSYVNGSTRLAINLGKRSIAWSSKQVDISGITNYTLESQAKNDFSGKSNTAAWVSYYGSSVTYYAPGYCYNYTTAGTSKGDWYLPAAGELYASIVTNFSAVKGGLNAAGYLLSYAYWSSSEPEETSAWIVFSGDGDMEAEFKNYYSYVLCVLAF